MHHKISLNVTFFSKIVLHITLNQLQFDAYPRLSQPFPSLPAFTILFYSFSFRTTLFHKSFTIFSRTSQTNLRGTLGAFLFIRTILLLILFKILYSFPHMSFKTIKSFPMFRLPKVLPSQIPPNKPLNDHSSFIFSSI